LRTSVSYLWVAPGGALGAMARFAVGRLAVATFGVDFYCGALNNNIGGSFLLGVFATLLSARLIEHADRIRRVVVGSSGSWQLAPLLVVRVRVIDPTHTRAVMGTTARNTRQPN